MQTAVEKAQGPIEADHKGYRFISPIGTKMRALIEHKVITTVSDFEAYKLDNQDHADYLDDVFMELIENGAISVEENRIHLNQNSIWASSNPSDLLKSLPELSREITRRALQDMAAKRQHAFLDFAYVFHFANDPEVTAKASSIITNCLKELRALSKLPTQRERNDSVRAIAFSGSLLDGGKK